MGKLVAIVLVSLAATLSVGCNSGPSEQQLKARSADAVTMPLGICFSSVVDYFQKPRVSSGGELAVEQFPGEMQKPVCPGGATIATITAEPALIAASEFEEGGTAFVLGEIGFRITDPARACYQLTSDAPGQTPADGQAFTCHAWTDLDGDGKVAHWYLKGTFDAATREFIRSCLERELGIKVW